MHLNALNICRWRGDVLKGIKTVLLLKIIITAALWAVPLMLIPSSLLNSMGFPVVDLMFVRLLGIAYFSLGVNYYFGYTWTKKNHFPVCSAWTGVISNGLSSIYLSFLILTGSILDWGRFAQAYIIVSALAAGGLAVAFLVINIRYMSRKKVD